MNLKQTSLLMIGYLWFSACQVNPSNRSVGTENFIHTQIRSHRNQLYPNNRDKGKNQTRRQVFRNQKINLTRHDLHKRHLGQIIGNETLKVLFCPIEKVMSTQFKQLFDRISGDELWFDHPYHKNRYHIFQNKSKEEVEKILTDPTWKKVVFFRDPTKRLLSAYLHLVKAPDSIKRYKNLLQRQNRSTTWNDFWQSAVAGMKNIHWEPQTNFCGLRKYWHLFNFVGNFEMIQNHGPMLSELLNLSQYTDNGWARTTIFKYPVGKKMKNRTQHLLSAPLPPDYNRGDCMWCVNRAQHQSNYTRYPIETFLTPQIWKQIRDSSLYKVDYEIFSKISSPPFNISFDSLSCAMLKAEQNALIQEANKQLLTIRREELEYFVSVFSDFGTLAALIAGFTVSILTQVDTLEAEINVFWKWLFWISCILTMICTLHVVLTTTFINIFGPGLALRGPAGSMVRAVEGMVKEKDSVFLAFFLSVVLFQSASLACCFVVMNHNAAWASTGIFLIGLWYWYKYCLRIYNRFKLEDIGFSWNDEKAPTQEPRVYLSSDSYTQERSGPQLNDSASAPSGRNQYAPKRRTIVQKLLGTNRPPGPNRDLTAPLVDGNYDSSTSGNYMEGYLTKKGDSSGFFSEPWTRRYFVLQDQDLFYYKSKEDYQYDPKKAIKNRPIDLTGYSITSAVGNQGELNMDLIPFEETDDRRAWEFRVDTQAELEAWTTAFIRAGVRPQYASND